MKCVYSSVVSESLVVGLNFHQKVKQSIPPFCSRLLVVDCRPYLTSFCYCQLLAHHAYTHTDAHKTLNRFVRSEFDADTHPKSNTRRNKPDHLGSTCFRTWTYLSEAMVTSLWALTGPRTITGAWTLYLGKDSATIWNVDSSDQRTVSTLNHCNSGEIQVITCGLFGRADKLWFSEGFQINLRI